MKKALLSAFIFLSTLVGYAQNTAKEWFDNGMTLYDDKNFTEAVKLFEKAIALDPQYSVAFYRAEIGRAHV